MMLLFIIILPLAACIASLLVRGKMRTLCALSIGAAFLELISAIAIMATVMQKGSYSFNGFFSIDAIGTLVMMIIALVGAMASWYSTTYLVAEMKKEIIGFRRIRQYFVLLHLFMAAMFFAVITTSPIFMWIAIEATTLSTAFLVSFYNKPSAMEAAWKYLIINSVGLLLGFFGVLLFLSPAIHAGLDDVISWQAVFAHIADIDPSVAKIAFIFVLIGFGTKVGLVPMHTWLPDAHSKAPAPISSLLSGVLLNVAFLAILRFKFIADAALGAQFSQNNLIFFGVVSVVVAVFIIFNQKNYKRLLAYSSIEHMGIISLGFGFGGAGAFAALLHMIFHSLAKSSLFLSAGNIFLKYGSTKIKNVSGVLTVLPKTGIMFFVGFLAITGVPPFGTFITEFSILSAGFHDHPIVIIIVLSALVMIFIGFLKHTSILLFGTPVQSIVKGENAASTVIPVAILIAIFVILSFFIPEGLQSLLNAAVLNINN